MVLRRVTTVKYSPLSKDDFICTYTTEGKEEITFGKKNTTIGYEDAELQVALKDSEIKLYTITDDQASEDPSAPAKINEAIKKALTDNPLLYITTVTVTMWCLSAISQRVRWLITRVESINLTIWPLRYRTQQLLPDYDQRHYAAR